MKNKFLSFLCLIAFSTAVYSDDACESNCTRYCCRGQSSSYGSAYSISSSMVTWGVLMFLGIGLVSAFIEPSLTTAHSDSSSDTTN